MLSPIRISNCVSAPLPSPDVLLPIQALCLFGRAPLLESLMNVTAPTADCTYAVVAICVVFVPGAAVGAVGVLTRAGEVASTIAPDPVVPFDRSPAEAAVPVVTRPFASVVTLVYVPAVPIETRAVVVPPFVVTSPVRLATVTP